MGYVITSSKKAVYTALVGNLGIAVAKLIAAILTGSIAMLVRHFIHCLIRLTKYSFSLESRQVARLPTESHPFGYGIAGIISILFGIAGIISLQHGFSSLVMYNSSYPEC